MIGARSLPRLSARGPLGGVRLPIAPLTRTPRVSVAVASYNYGRFLGDCLESVVTQTGVEVEVIVVDDASTDDTPQVAAAYAERDPRVRVIRHATNAGHLATFNEGLRAASGDYVLKLDADDMLAPGALARAAAVMDAHPGVGLVYGRPLHFEGEPPAVAPGSASGCVVWPGGDWLAERCRTSFNCISNPEAVVRRSLLDTIGYYSPSLPHTFDFEMWMRLAAVSDIARVEGVEQGLYRVHEASFQRTIHAGVLFDMQARLDAFEVLFAGVAGDRPDADALRARALRQIARQALDRACRAYDRGRVDEDPVEGFVALAFAAYPQARTLREWGALERRRSVGPRLAHVAPPFVARAALRRLREDRQHRRWRRHGV